jgi:hypothetical protein
VTTGRVLTTALGVVLARPTTWLLALAGFLIRGGILVVLLPIVTLPTPVGLANVVGPSIVSFVFGGPTIGIVILVLLSFALLMAWLLGGGFLAATMEVAVIAAVAADPELAPSSPPVTLRRRAAGWILGARLFALAPLLAAFVFGATRLVAATYAELTLPTDATTPIVWRVLAAAPEAVVVIVIAWVLGEIVGATWARRLALGQDRTWRAIGRGIGDVLRRPLRTIILFLVPTLVVALVVIPAAAAAAATLAAVHQSFDPLIDPLLAFATLVAFVALWIGGLALIGMVCAWRQAVWTVDAVSRTARTFGSSTPTPAGGWNPAEVSGTL